MKKILALILALVMVLALTACGGSGAAPEAPAEAPAEEPAAAPAEAPAAEAGDDFAEYKAYFGAYAAAGAPNEEEANNMLGLIDACATFEDIQAIPQSTVLFENVGVLTFDAWLAAGKPAADTEGMVSEAAQQGASGEASGEASDEPAEAAEEEASEEPTGEPPAQPIEFTGAVEGIEGELPTEIVMSVELTLADGYSLEVEGGTATNEGNVWTVTGNPGPDTVYVTVVG